MRHGIPKGWGGAGRQGNCPHPSSREGSGQAVSHSPGQMIWWILPCNKTSVKTLNDGVQKVLVSERTPNSTGTDTSALKTISPGCHLAPSLTPQVL